MKIAGDRPDLLDAALAFSPGEYFERFGLGATWIGDSARHIECPAFITSARSERKHWQPIFARIPEDERTFFLPTTKGNHGSRALWKRFDDSGAYWRAAGEFLAPFVLTRGADVKEAGAPQPASEDSPSR